jgi:hypothetical protein
MSWYALLKYWKQILGVTVLLAALVWAYRLGGTSARLDCATERAAALKAIQADRDEWQERAYKADEALAKALKAPKAAPAVDEVIRANPSGCNMPKPVGDRVRQAIREANTAARGS